MISPQQYRNQNSLDLPSFGGQNARIGSSVPTENYSGRFGGPVMGQNTSQSMPRDNNFVQSS